MERSAVLMHGPPVHHAISAHHKLVQWRYPKHGSVGINCDGSFRSCDGRGGYGVVVRDHCGKFIAAKASCFHESHLPIEKGGEGEASVEYGVIVLMIEMLAIREGLGLAGDLKLRDVEIHSDSKTAVSILRGRAECPIECRGVFHDIVREMPSFRELGFFFVYRESNRAADFLSKLLTQHGDRYFGFRELPRRLNDIIIEDRLGIATVRFQDSPATRAVRGVLLVPSVVPETLCA